MDANNITPRFEFGFGLSYTTFKYSDLSIASSGDDTTVTFTVANSGSVDGTEIPQLYLGFPEGAGEPPRVLRGGGLYWRQRARLQMRLLQDVRGVLAFGVSLARARPL